MHLNLRESFFQAQILMQRVRGGAQGADSGTPGTEARAAALVEGASEPKHTRLPPAASAKAVDSLFSRSKRGHFETASNGVDLPIPLPKPAANYREPDAPRGAGCTCAD